MLPNSLLRHTVTFRKRTKNQSSTSGQPNYIWSDFQVGVRCRIDEASGREYPSTSGKYVKADHILFVNKSSLQFAINEKDYRAVISSFEYNILLIADAGGAGQHYEIALERIY
ncbi:MAG: head-tail adaptor protein [Endomicrobiales bacterium]|nr:head-tail adaptor protein [Endomicrobiales bacterium]